jgi:hypothetical protein
VRQRLGIRQPYREQRDFSVIGVRGKRDNQKRPKFFPVSPKQKATIGGFLEKRNSRCKRFKGLMG